MKDKYFIARFKYHFLNYKKEIQKIRELEEISFYTISKNHIPNSKFIELVLTRPLNSYYLLVCSIPDNPIIEIYFNTKLLNKALNKIEDKKKIDNLAKCNAIHEVGHILNTEDNIILPVLYWIGKNYPDFIRDHEKIEDIVFSISEAVAEDFLVRNATELGEVLRERRLDFIGGIKDLLTDDTYGEEARNKVIRMSIVCILFYLTNKWQYIEKLCNKYNFTYLNRFMKDYLQGINGIVKILKSNIPQDRKTQNIGEEILNIIRKNDKENFISMIYPIR